MEASKNPGFISKVNKIEPTNNFHKEKLEPDTKVENWVLVMLPKGHGTKSSGFPFM